MEENKIWRLSWVIIMSNEKIIDRDDTFNKEKLGLFFESLL